jgi:hypothetical protein
MGGFFSGGNISLPPPVPGIFGTFGISGRLGSGTVVGVVGSLTSFGPTPVMGFDMARTSRSIIGEVAPQAHSPRDARLPDGKQ